MRFSRSAFGPFKKEKIKNLKKQEIHDQNEQDKTCFQHDIAHGDFKDLTRRTASDKILHDKAFNIAKNLKYAGYQRGLPSIVYKFFDKEISAICVNKFAGSGIKNENISNKESAEELHKPIIRKFKKRLSICN